MLRAVSLLQPLLVVFLLVIAATRGEDNDHGVGGRQLLGHGGGHHFGGFGGFHRRFNAFHRPRPNFSFRGMHLTRRGVHSFKDFAEGVGEGLVKGIGGDHAWTACKDAYHAGYAMYDAHEAWSAGNRAKAWDYMGKAGKDILHAGANAAEAAVYRAKDVAVDGLKGAALTAIQAVPGADVAADAYVGGEMAYEGYHLTRDCSEAFQDIRHGNWHGAGEAVGDTAVEMNDAVHEEDDKEDGVKENGFRNWPDKKRRRSLEDTVPKDSAVQQREREALLAIYGSLGGKAWLDSEGWGSSASACTWDRVTCDAAGRITELVIPVNNLKGSFPGTEVWNALPLLSRLDLYGNDLEGDFAGVCTLAALEILNLGDNRLSSIPACLYTMSTLRRVNLRENGFTGSFPTAFLNMATLRSLDISGNQFSGEIPHQGWSKMANLTDLDLSRNRFTGSLKGLEAATQLESLEVSHNDFTGSLTEMPWHQRLPWLRHLYLNNNTGLTGQLPAKLGNVHRLSTFDISDTAVSGTIPASWATLNLRDFAASNTQIGGVLPVATAGGRRSNQLTGLHFSCPAPQGYDSKAVGCSDASRSQESDSLQPGVIAVLVLVAVAVVSGIALFVANRQGATDDRLAPSVPNPVEDGPSYMLMDDRAAHATA